MIRFSEGVEKESHGSQLSQTWKEKKGNKDSKD